MEKQAILYLDDEESNLNVFKATFKRDYKVFTTTSPSEAFEIIEKEPIKVVLSDQRMPEISGTEFLKKLLDKHPEVIRIILTAYTDVEIVVGAFNDSKIYRYVTKPWDATELNVTIQNALESYELKSRNKNLVSELKEANTNLEKKVKKRTLELDKANKTKDKLFSIISKELNKPINDLSDYLELMLNFDNAINFESSKKYAKEISNALLETKTQMENLFCWSTLQLGATEVNIENCIINNYIKQNIETSQYKAIKKRIRLKSNVSKEIIKVKADKNMLNFIFRSLLNNAIKFTPLDGRVEIFLEVEENKAIVTVSDNGVSIPDSKKGGIINLNTTPSKGTNGEQGLGIGLIICKDYLGILGGTLEIDNNKLSGVDVKFSLPLTIE